MVTQTTQVISVGTMLPLQSKETWCSWPRMDSKGSGCDHGPCQRLVRHNYYSLRVAQFAQHKRSKKWTLLINPTDKLAFYEESTLELMHRQVVVSIPKLSVPSFHVVIGKINAMATFFCMWYLWFPKWSVILTVILTVNTAVL